MNEPAPTFEGAVCPLPLRHAETIVIGHGSAIRAVSLPVVVSNSTECRFDFMATGRSIRCRAESASSLP